MCLILSEISEISWQKVNSFSIAGNLFDGILVKGNTDSLAFLNINFETCYYSLKLIITDYFVISKSYGYGTDYTCTLSNNTRSVTNFTKKRLRNFRFYYRIILVKIILIKRILHFSLTSYNLIQTSVQLKIYISKVYLGREEREKQFFPSLPP